MTLGYRRQWTQNRKVKDFVLGLITSLEDFNVPPGGMTDVDNWLETGGVKEISRGIALKGTANDSPPAGQDLKITGIHKAKLKDDTEVLMRKDGRRLMIYKESVSDWVECNTANIFPIAAQNEDVFFTSAETEVGTQVIFGSPNSGLWRMHAANPYDPFTVYVSGTNYKGWPKFIGQATFIFNFVDKGINVSDFRRSNFTKVTNYTTVSGEVLASGDGVTKTFTGTLAFKAGNPYALAFGPQVTDGTETFTDDGCGNYTGSAGGTGTINYATGAYSVTFSAAPILAVSNITGNYYHENSNNAGITDFRFTSPARTAGEGLYEKQGQGGKLLNITNFRSNFYMWHETIVYRFYIGEDDLDVSIINIPYLYNTGLPAPLALSGTGEGMYFVDARDQEDPNFRIEELAQGSTELVPRSISKPWLVAKAYEGLDLTDYRFEDAVSYDWGQWEIFECRYKDSAANDTMFLFRKAAKSWTKLPKNFRMFAVYNGALVGGSSISQNVFTLFSGFTEEDNLISNQVAGPRDNLGYPDDLKKFQNWYIRGLIQDNVRLKVYMAFDGGDYAFVGNIDWDGTYVDRTQQVLIGTNTIGSKEIGGSEDVFAYPYRHEIRIGTPYFNEVKVKYIAIVKPNTGETEDLSGCGGYVNITEEGPKGLLRLGRRMPTKYTTENNS